jgi:hypothetical protein
MADKINLEELQIITNKIFDHIIKTRNVKSIDLVKNYYLEIDSEDLYDIATKPSEFTIGSLKDNWEFLSELLNQESIPVAYQLTELAPLLNYIGEALAKELAQYGG